MGEEPRYTDSFDERGDFVDKLNIPKWRLPGTDWQRRVLAAAKLKYWPAGPGWKDARSKFLVIEKSMSSLATGVVPKYPTEFIDEVIRWYETKSFMGQNVLKGMLGPRGFENLEWKARVVNAWKKAHPDAGAETDYGQELPPQEKWSND